MGAILRKSLCFQGNIFQKVCVTGLTLSGTGKTYASAFALRDEGPKKVLFVVHREQIARQAMASYKRVFGNTRTFALLSGNSRGQEGDYLFATMQMMSKDEVMHGFRPDSFDTIVIDDCEIIGLHRKAASTKAFQV